MENSEFEDKVVLITGGGGGTLGPAMAEAYVARGAIVAICDRRAQKCDERAERLRRKTKRPVLSFGVDIADRAALREMVRAIETQVGGVDILIGNAAEVHFEEFATYPAAQWDRIIEVCLTANFLLAQLVLPGMVAKGGGNLLFIGSVASWIHASDLLPGEFSYAIAKNGLVTLTRTLAAEFGKHNIRCNGLSPGLIESGFTRSNEEFSAKIRERTPMKKLGTPHDIVKSALFLTSDTMSGFITGETICVSGGLHMRV